MKRLSPREIYRAEKERAQRERGVSHAELMAEAQRAFDKLLADAKAARKSGRPKRATTGAPVTPPKRTKAPATPAAKTARPGSATKGAATKSAATKKAAKTPARAKSSRKAPARASTKTGATGAAKKRTAKQTRKKR